MVIQRFEKSAKTRTDSSQIKLAFIYLIKSVVQIGRFFKDFEKIEHKLAILKFLISSNLRIFPPWLEELFCRSVRKTVRISLDFSLSELLGTNFSHVIFQIKILIYISDLKMMTDVAGNPEEERHTDFYYQPWASEAVCRYFYQKIQQKRAELDSVLGLKSSA